MRANVKYASVEALAASRRLQEMELIGEPRPEWGLLSALAGLFYVTLILQCWR